VRLQAARLAVPRAKAVFFAPEEGHHNRRVFLDHHTSQPQVEAMIDLSRTLVG
jgi:hypothetical protein